MENITGLKHTERWMSDLSGRGKSVPISSESNQRKVQWSGKESGDAGMSNHKRVKSSRHGNKVS